MSKASPHKRDDVARHRVTFECLRAIRGISNADVARKTGLSVQTIKNLRTPTSQGGTVFPQLHTVAVIAKAYGLELMLVPKRERAFLSAQVNVRASRPEAAPLPN